MANNSSSVNPLNLRIPYLTDIHSVVVKRLLSANRTFDGPDGSSRGPQIGDCGEWSPANEPGKIRVECRDIEDNWLWTATFDAGEVAHFCTQPLAWSDVSPEFKQIADTVRLGMSRQDVVALLGPPPIYGIPSKNCQDWQIYKYGEVELHFEFEETGKLWLIFMHDQLLRGISISLNHPGL